MDFNRRTALLATTAAAIAPVFEAYAREASELSVAPRGNVGVMRRLPRLDLESYHNYLVGQRQWQSGKLARAGAERASEILKANGLNPESDIPLSTLLPLFEKDPVIALNGRAFLEIQRLKFTTLRDEVHRNADAYYAELEAADKAGPGTLEMSPKMVIPEYTKHEIHTQIGGYVGDPFAGYIYNYGTNVFFGGRNDQDELYEAMAAATPVPTDNKVKRILDLGCGAGQLSTSLKKRFPDAEVWAIDVGAPMIRYGHMRANEMGRDVNFAQRLAEDTKFPDGHFDIVASYIMFHEVTADASREIVKEAQRVLRPGGVFYPMDFFTANPPPTRPIGKFTSWWDHRWNNEVWRMEYAGLDFNGAMTKVGLKVANGPASAGGGRPNVMATKA